MNNVTKKNNLAGIEYGGIAGGSQDCQNAVERLLQFGYEIVRAQILSFSRSHCLLLTNHIGDLTAIKSGFSSGYGGEGPRRFSYVLQLLETFGVEIEEYEVKEAFLNRLDFSGLTISDLDTIKNAKPIWPSKWHEYIWEDHFESATDGRSFEEFPLIMPFSIIDSRIADLAISFWKSPDGKLFTAYRRLEDLLRERTGLTEHGLKLFSRIFGNPPILSWTGIDDGERTGRLNLFTGAFMAYRNPRAHRELKISPDKQLSEFLLLNHLYRLEKESQETISS